MKVARLCIENFRGVKGASIHFTGHSLLVGTNNVGKSTICEALDILLSADRLQSRTITENHGRCLRKILLKS